MPEHPTAAPASPVQGCIFSLLSSSVSLPFSIKTTGTLSYSGLFRQKSLYKGSTCCWDIQLEREAAYLESQSLEMKRSRTLTCLETCAPTFLCHSIFLALSHSFTVLACSSISGLSLLLLLNGLFRVISENMY